MKTNIRILFAMLLLTTLSVSGQITFERTYGGFGMDFGNSVLQTSDNGYILLGSTESFSDSREVYLIKTDQYGDTLWTKTYNGSTTDFGQSIQQTMDGGYIICGEKDLKTLLIKTNDRGDTLWTRTYSGIGHSIEQAPDSGYVVAGTTWSNDVRYNMLLYKTKPNGDLIWEKSYGNKRSQYCWDFKQTFDGGYILVGSTDEISTSGIYLVRTNSMGDTLWTRTIEGSGFAGGYSLDITSDNGYIIYGYSGNSDGYKFYLVKTDVNGDTLWSKTYENGNYNSGQVRQTPDGGYIFVASTDKNDFPNKAVYLVKTDSNGDTLWTRTYKQGCGTGLQITSDGGYIIVGYIFGLSGEMNNDIYLLKTDMNGITTGIKNRKVNSDISAKSYPNPFNDFVTIEFENSRNISYDLLLYTTQGQLKRIIKNITTSKVTLERGDLESGLYIFQILAKKEIYTTGKIIIE
jgi:hypothetical protein